MNPYCKLAKSATEYFIKTGKHLPAPKDVSNNLLDNKAGIFVSIHKGKELKGCVGTFLPTKPNIAQEIISSSISACQDSRFKPIQPSEFDSFSYEVYILDEPKPIKSFEELDPKKYGVLVRSKYKSGLLLPDLEGVDNIETQLGIACQKAGIDPNKEQFWVYKFSAKKYVSD